MYYSPPTRQSHLSYAMKPVLPTQTTIRPVHNPMPEKIDAAACIWWEKIWKTYVKCVSELCEYGFRYKSTIPSLVFQAHPNLLTKLRRIITQQYLMVFGAYSNLCYLINIRTCLMKSGKHESRIVKADYGCVNSNNWILKYLTAIQHGIQPQIKADFRVIFE